jgi:hypothetical protein
MVYRPRIVDSELAEALAAVGAVLIEGPKACGKTATARQAAHSEVRLDVDAEARLAAATDPRSSCGGNRLGSSTSGNSSQRSGTTCVERSMIARRVASSS